MSCWRVLELTDQPSCGRIPPLLVKPQFGSDAYSIFITDLTNIWNEELDLCGIIGRSSEEESPIEVSKEDTAQLGILLENVQRSLICGENSSCCITRTDTDGIILNTTIALPEPLDSLRWRFSLDKRTSMTLKNELVLPLLVSSHIQHERIKNLIATIDEKDRAITRLVDQYEASNLDLAAAFPSVGGGKPGRRLVRREQAARHIPGLQHFDEVIWKRKTADLQDTNVSTFDLFQEALAECTPAVPLRLKLGDEIETWWKSIDSTLKPISTVKPNAKANKTALLTPRKPATDIKADDEETEDEFETHDNFKLRETTKQIATSSQPTRASGKIRQVIEDDTASNDEDEDADDDDLDAPPKSKSQSQTRTQLDEMTPPVSLSQVWPRRRPFTRTPVVSSEPKTTSLSSPQFKAKGFRIGGQAKKSRSPLVSTEEVYDVNQVEEMPTRVKTTTGDPIAVVEVGTKTAKKTFKIGGKSRIGREKDGAETLGTDSEKNVGIPAPSSESTRSVSREVARESTHMKECLAETAEEKAERRRHELKRKNEETTKKQAQSKKKKRF